MYLIFPTATAISEVSILPSNQELYPGDTFDIYIYMEPKTPIAGAQLDISYDSDMIKVNNVDGSAFFEQDGISSIFIGGNVDNSQGTINGLFAVTLGKTDVVSAENFAHISFTALENTGNCTINLYNVILSDYSGNALPISIQDAQISIIGQSTTTTPEEVAVSSGGGGGGGGGDTGESPDNIEFKEVNKLYITGNTDVSYTFDDNNNPVKAISYTSLKNAGFISTTIEVLKDVSTTVSQKPAGLIYRNMNIWVGKAGYATENNMESMKISFAVLKKWVQVNDVNTDAIYMNRYNEGKWQVLETEMTGEDDDFYFYEAKTPGFSPFAITANSASENAAESEQVNAASSYEDPGSKEETEEIEAEQVTDESSEFIKDETHSAKLSQNSLLLLLISISFLVILIRTNKL
ncbi:PGF-pre-PGF domain-containing protein [Methanolobus bombayensis]|uniref:PGF-pre-PGF domain-containing protein n=1 Tax=Methanolobus bombayensis TaxID=38023 RepID=UPI001AE62378|nr:PGF-pre-PGF domain-containing protein [Methanolobus bombayensis]MBP1909969.1 PGF-pre-PGF domain-containing protein [Methanolobus bombayensis]